MNLCICSPSLAGTLSEIIQSANSWGSSRQCELSVLRLRLCGMLAKTIPHSLSRGEIVPVSKSRAKS